MIVDLVCIAACVMLAFYSSKFIIQPNQFWSRRHESQMVPGDEQSPCRERSKMIPERVCAILCAALLITCSVSFFPKGLEIETLVVFGVMVFIINYAFMSLFWPKVSSPYEAWECAPSKGELFAVREVFSVGLVICILLIVLTLSKL